MTEIDLSKIYTNVQLGLVKAMQDYVFLEKAGLSPDSLNMVKARERVNTLAKCFDMDDENIKETLDIYREALK